MAKNKQNILVLDDEDSMRKTYKNILKSTYNPVIASNAQEAFKAVEEIDIQIMLLDMRMPDMNGLDVLKKIKEIDPGIEVIVITAVPEFKNAVNALKKGAFDYIAKPFEVDELMITVEAALKKKDLEKENQFLRQTLDEQEKYHELIGMSERMVQVRELIGKFAPTNSTVLITGESGTGKELVANAIHRKSPRLSRPFIVVNCAALPENLIESELFGYERGAFTGAMERKEGKFELADGGTIFLDEIGCMKPYMQSKLLRVLQDNVIERVGGRKPIQTDVRIISATNVEIEESITKGEFRQDLFYRLNVLRIEMPSLKERKEDIQLLLDHFLVKYSRKFNKKAQKFESELLRSLMEYDWPGNVRELENLVERAVVMCDGPTIRAQDMMFKKK